MAKTWVVTDSSHNAQYTFTSFSPESARNCAIEKAKQLCRDFYIYELVGIVRADVDVSVKHEDVVEVIAA